VHRALFLCVELAHYLEDGWLSLCFGSHNWSNCGMRTIHCQGDTRLALFPCNSRENDSLANRFAHGIVPPEK
jgi:hypothetical protein